MQRHLFGMLSAATIALVGCTAYTARKTEPLAPPVDTADPQVAHGEKVFFQQCHQCHPHGEAGLGPAIVTGVHAVPSNADTENGSPVIASTRCELGSNAATDV